MDLVIGFFSLSLVIIIFVIFAIKWPNLSRIIFIAVLLRLLFILIHTFIIPLPDSSQDAMGIEKLAWSWAQGGFQNILDHFPGYNSFFYTWLMALIYSIFGRIILIIQSLNLMFGVGSVILVWFIAKKLWDDKTANKCAWIAALFPTLILYTALPLREVYNIFFLLVAFWGIVNWYKSNNIKYFLITIFGFICASFFHAVLLVGGMIFLFFVGVSSLRKFLKKIVYGKIEVFTFLITFAFLYFSFLYLSNNIYIPYLGTFDQMLDFEWLKFNMNIRMRGDATYPEWLKINSFFEMSYKGFLRTIYFMYSPFFWQITKISHILGFFDSVLYMIVSYYVFLNFSRIWNDDCLRMILIILICYVFIYGFGVSNFGAGIRHRTKFICELILLAGPMIPKIVFFSKRLKNPKN